MTDTYDLPTERLITHKSVSYQMGSVLSSVDPW
jgi:hypothetical protein